MDPKKLSPLLELMFVEHVRALDANQEAHRLSVEAAMDQGSRLLGKAHL